MRHNMVLVGRGAGRWVAIMSVAVLVAGLSLSLPQAAYAIEGLVPANPQPDPDEMEEGLAVKYYYGMYRKISELETMMKYKKGEPGEPLPQLKYRSGRGNVLSSEFDNGVGALISGYINFANAGTYTMKVNSNDGVQLRIGGKLIHEDPDVHPDTMSDPIPVTITEPGWYPILVKYFERKNTSTLVLYWNNEVVPPEAFAHIEQ